MKVKNISKSIKIELRYINKIPTDGKTGVYCYFADLYVNGKYIKKVAPLAKNKNLAFNEVIKKLNIRLYI